ncbi:hypothetical protein TNCV_709781 [Trichonephila clavipes]|nr:hypothetical protein TNCV_709781 [Trichonephila clavipes]
MCIHHDATKHECDHLDAVNRYVVEDAPVFDAASMVAAAMVSELRVHAVANIIELFVHRHLLSCNRP